MSCTQQTSFAPRSLCWKTKNKNKQTKQGGTFEVIACLNKDCVCILLGMMAELMCIDFLLDQLAQPPLTYESNYIQNRVSYKFLSKNVKFFPYFSLLLPYQSSACRGNPLPVCIQQIHTFLVHLVCICGFQENLRKCGFNAFVSLYLLALLLSK